MLEKNAEAHLTRINAQVAFLERFKRIGNNSNMSADVSINGAVKKAELVKKLESGDSINFADERDRLDMLGRFKIQTNKTTMARQFGFKTDLDRVEFAVENNGLNPKKLPMSDKVAFGGIFFESLVVLKTVVCPAEKDAGVNRNQNGTLEFELARKKHNQSLDSAAQEAIISVFTQAEKRGPIKILKAGEVALHPVLNEAIQFEIDRLKQERRYALCAAKIAGMGKFKILRNGFSFSKKAVVTVTSKAEAEAMAEKLNAIMEPLLGVCCQVKRSTANSFTLEIPLNDQLRKILEAEQKPAVSPVTMRKQSTKKDNLVVTVNPADHTATYSASADSKQILALSTPIPKPGKNHFFSESKSSATQENSKNLPRLSSGEHIIEQPIAAEKDFKNLPVFGLLQALNEGGDDLYEEVEYAGGIEPFHR